MSQTVRLIGVALAQISTPHGLIQLNRNGEAVISGGKLEFIRECIDGGRLPGYELKEEDRQAAANKSLDTDPNAENKETPPASIADDIVTKAKKSKADTAEGS